MFVSINFGWLIFRAKNWDQIKYFIHHLIYSWDLPPAKEWEIFKINLFWVCIFYFIVLWADFVKEKNDTDEVINFSKGSHYIWALLMLLIILLYPGNVNQFVYFQF